MSACKSFVTNPEEIFSMASKKSKSPSDLLSDVFGQAVEVMSDLTTATTTASVNASLASARHLVKFQKGSAKAGLKLVGRVHEYTEKSLREAVKKGEWMPKEGKDVVDEWSKMMRSGIDEFSRVMDKSFDLLLTFIERAEKDARNKDSKKPAKKKSAAKKPAAKKKSAAKKSTARKPAAKKKSAAGSAN